MTSSINFFCGGKLGDLIHTLWIIKQTWKETQKKGVLILSDKHGGDVFAMGMETTFIDVRPFIIQQEYIEDVQLVSEKVEYSPPNINLNIWRNSRNLLRVDWITLFSQVFFTPDFVPDRRAWLKVDSVAEYKETFQDTIVVHQSLQRHNKDFHWEKVLQQNKCVFVTCDVEEYNKFAFKHLVPCHLAKNLLELVRIISVCKGFCGNQSAPLALAIALGKTCYCELYIYDKGGYQNITDYVYYGNYVPDMLEGSLRKKIL